jgi:hypothetical protein
MDFLAFSPEYLYHVAGMIRENIGSIFSVMIYAFLGLLGLYATIEIIDRLGR